MRNRIRHRNLRAQRRNSWRKRFVFWFDAWSGWICVLLVGVSAGRLITILNYLFHLLLLLFSSRSRRWFC
jgi:hypothetical protein